MNTNSSPSAVRTSLLHAVALVVVPVLTWSSGKLPAQAPPIAALTLYEFEAGPGERDVGEQITFADYDRDGFTDIAYSVVTGTPARFHIVIRSGKDGTQLGYWTLGAGATKIRLSSGDHSNNGIYHIFVAYEDPTANWGAGLFTFYWGNGAWWGGWGVHHAAMPSIGDMATGDFTNNGRPNYIVSTNEQPAKILAMYNSFSIAYTFFATSNLAPGAAVACNDVNGDNHDDILFGDPEYYSTAQQERTGAIHIYDGSTGNFLQTIEGEDDGDDFGADLEAGDINNDGMADIIVGAPNHDVSGNNDAGAVYVYDGATYNLLHLITGSAANEHVGRTVTMTHDYAVDVFAVGSVNPATGAGRVWIYEGVSGLLGNTLDGPAGDANYGRRFVIGNLIDNSTHPQLIIGDPHSTASLSRVSVVSTDVSSLMGVGCGTNALTIAVNSVRTSQPVTLSGTALVNAPVFLLGTIFTPAVPTFAMNCPVYIGAGSAVLGLVTADAAGNWSLGIPTNPLPPGIEVTVQAWSVDSLGTALISSPGWRFEVQP